jgi:hypothetical protein
MSEEARTDSKDGPFPADWTVPGPLAIPPPTYAPATLAFGITLLFWGLIASPVVLGAGLVIVVGALVAWMGELRHDG